MYGGGQQGVGFGFGGQQGVQPGMMAPPNSPGIAQPMPQTPHMGMGVGQGMYAPLAQGYGAGQGYAGPPVQHQGQGYGAAPAVRYVPQQQQAQRIGTGYPQTHPAYNAQQGGHRSRGGGGGGYPQSMGGSWL